LHQDKTGPTKKKGPTVKKNITMVEPFAWSSSMAIVLIANPHGNIFAMGSNKKPESNKLQGKDIESFESTISCDKKKKKKSKESINECKEIDQEKSTRLLELEKRTTA
jgi:hypothetical protein